MQGMSNEEIIELHLMDPYFLNFYCCIFTLELQLQKENRKNKLN